MKRFTETNKWRDPWYRKLSGRAKNLWSWLCDNCDNSGVIDVDIEAATFDIREPIDENHLRELSERLQRLPNGKYWIVKFVPFQYGNLSRNCTPHVRVLDLLLSHGISYQKSPTLSSSEPTRVGTTLQEKTRTIKERKGKEGGCGGSQTPDGGNGASPENITPQERNFPEVAPPTLVEFQTHCAGIGIPAWYASDKWLAAEQDFWKNKGNWRAYATRCLTWWTADGRPKTQPTNKKQSQTVPNEIHGSTSHTLIPGNTGV